MNVYLLYCIDWATSEERCDGWVRARTPEGAAKKLNRVIYGKTHNCHGKRFDCTENQWLVWGTGAYVVYWIELIPRAPRLK